MTSWLRRLRVPWGRVRSVPKSLQSFRPAVEPLENRIVMAGNVLQTNLVSDLPGVAQLMDPHLVNPWGIAESGGSPFWISDNNAGVSTLYNTPTAPGSPPLTINPLVVSIPAPGDPTGASGTPTGTVFNIDMAGGGFMIKSGTTSKPAIFLFATEDGTIVGWNPGINPVGSDPAKAGTFGTIAVDNSANPTAADGAVYKGLAIGTDTSGRTLLYASNFRSGHVDVFDTNFNPASLPTGAFTDPDLPRGYAPFGIQELGGKIYVTYALQDSNKHDDVAGNGHGFVDVFNLDGTPGLAGGKERLISRGALDSPWGLALAPSSFGSLANSLLVGNFGNGKINAFDPSSGASVGELSDPDGEDIQIDGLWGLKVGNGAMGGSANSVYFTAGIDHESHGLFGSLTPVAPGTPEGPAEAQVVQAALDIVQLNLATVQQDISSGVTRAQLRQDLQAFNTSVVDLIRAELRFVADAAHDAHPKGGSSTEVSAQDIHALFAEIGSLRWDFD